MPDPTVFSWTNFAGSVASTAIGASLGFTFSVVLFFFKERQETQGELDRIRAALLGEASYNLSLVDDLSMKLKDLLGHATLDSRSQAMLLPYSSFMSFSVNDAHKLGFLIRLLGESECLAVTGLESRFSKNAEEIINSRILDWSQGHLPNKDLLVFLNEQLLQLANSKEVLENLLARLKSELPAKSLKRCHSPRR